MYRRILVPLEHSRYDDAILAHVSELARCCHSAVLLIHVADGWAARNQQQLDLRESEEMQEDRAYLERVTQRLEATGVDVDAVLANGDPADEILAACERERCDLIAMATHGHGFLGDLVLGSVAHSVRHRAMVPVLLLRGSKEAKPEAPKPPAAAGEPPPA